MNISISNEDKLILQELTHDLLSTFYSVLNKVKVALLFFFQKLLQWIFSFEEFRLSNVKEKGLVNILIHRAMRFFKIEEQSRGTQYRKDIKTKTYIKRRLTAKRFFKSILFPVYLIILVIYALRRSIKSRNVKPMNKT